MWLGTTTLINNNNIANKEITVRKVEFSGQQEGITPPTPLFDSINLFIINHIYPPHHLLSSSLLTTNYESAQFLLHIPPQEMFYF